MADAGYLFHYYRLTEDQRILCGGWDAFYSCGNRIARDLEERPDVHAKLAEHFFTTLPQLEGVRFTHRGAGVIGTCSRLCAFWGTAVDGRVSYSLGYTGLGVAASRFGAQVALDLVGGAPTELTQLQMVRSRPLPFPPEPLRLPLIEITRRSTEHAKPHGGRRNLWLRTLDRLAWASSPSRRAPRPPRRRSRCLRSVSAETGIEWRRRQSSSVRSVLERCFASRW